MYIKKKLTLRGQVPLISFSHDSQGMRRAFSISTIQNFCPKPNQISYPYLSLLEKCTNLKDLNKIHAHIITLGLIKFTYITSRILSFYVAHNAMHFALQLLDQIPTPTIFNWNTMMIGFLKGPTPEKGLLIYNRMRYRGVSPDMHTFPCLIKACSDRASMSQIHGQVIKFSFDADVFVTSSLINRYCRMGEVALAYNVFDKSPNRNVVCWTSLISGYSSCGLVDKAQEIFDRAPEKNDVSWSAMISGYVQNERHLEAIELFRELRDHVCVKLNRPLLVSVLTACGALGASDDGRWIHSYIDETGFEYGLELGTALVDFYAKCGLIECSREVFDKMPRKDVTAWSAMIMGLALNGHCLSAIKIFSEMLKNKITPNAITFIGVLTACNHGGLVDKGRSYFDIMTKSYNVIPTFEHYGCIVDLLSRAGCTTEANMLIQSMPMEPDAAIWGSLLNGCMMHGDFDLGERAGRRVIELEPGHCGRYVSLANVYAMMGRWEGVTEVRKAMRERGVKVTPGWSLIEVDGVGHGFLVDDKAHPQLEEIYKMLELVSSCFGRVVVEIV